MGLGEDLALEAPWAGGTHDFGRKMSETPASGERLISIESFRFLWRPSGDPTYPGGGGLSNMDQDRHAEGVY